jgi:hypothetical protein
MAYLLFEADMLFDDTSLRALALHQRGSLGGDDEFMVAARDAAHRWWGGGGAAGRGRGGRDPRRTPALLPGPHVHLARAPEDRGAPLTAL